MSYFWKDQRLSHLSQLEAFIWTKFLEEHGSEYLSYNYDVLLEKPITLPKDFPATYKSNALQLSSLRIDVVIEDKKQIYVCEIRPEARHSAIGTLLMYRYLYILQYNPRKPVRMMLITNKYDLQIEFTCRQVEIGYFVY